MPDVLADRDIVEESTLQALHDRICTAREAGDPETLAQAGLDAIACAAQARGTAVTLRARLRSVLDRDRHVVPVYRKGSAPCQDQ